MLLGQFSDFGVKPEYPETGYGYIESTKILNNDKGRKIKRFIEKPSLLNAKNTLKIKSFGIVGFFFLEQMIF